MIKNSLDELCNCHIVQLVDGPHCGWKAWISNLKKVTMQFDDRNSEEVVSMFFMAAKVHFLGVGCIISTPLILIFV